MKAYTVLHFEDEDTWLAYTDTKTSEDDAMFDSKEDALFHVLMHGRLKRISHNCCTSRCRHIPEQE